MIFMPNELCRKCGCETREYTKCTICNQTSKYFCPTCNTQTIEQFHFDCVTKKQIGNAVIH